MACFGTVLPGAIIECSGPTPQSFILETSPRSFLQTDLNQEDTCPHRGACGCSVMGQSVLPLPPCHDSKESMQVYKQHCKIAEEYHEVKKEIALLEERKKELIARLEQAEKESMDAAQLAEEYAALTEENRTLKLAQTQCVEQLEKLRIQYQKRQGSS
uniref:MAP3K7 C-terminal like n=2 Tax=Crocodylus porosus TaxID=8502 RepID=A0A7M4F7N5_CROPO